MAKQSGLGDQFYVAGNDLSGDTNSIGRISGGPAAMEMTGLNVLAVERIGGLRDGGIDWVSYFNKAASTAHPTLSALPLTDVHVMYAHGNMAAPVLGAPGAALVSKQIDYAPTRAQDGALTMAVSSQANGFGLEWGVLGTAGKRTDGTATNGSPVDNGAASAFGLQAYLQVFSFTGTSVTVKLQESSDNGADVYADVVGGGFTAATGKTAQRIATSGALAVERYLRVVTTGTFSSAVFAVLICRNPVAVSF